MKVLQINATYGYGSTGLIVKDIGDALAENGDEAEFYQSNIEGELVNKLHEAFLSKTCDGILLNAGAFTHYSYALRDAIAAINIPVAEVHISNVHAREEFRHTSVISEVCKGVVCGFGVASYLAAILGLKETLCK